MDRRGGEEKNNLSHFVDLPDKRYREIAFASPESPDPFVN